MSLTTSRATSSAVPPLTFTHALISLRALHSSSNGWLDGWRLRLLKVKPVFFVTFAVDNSFTIDYFL